MGRHAKVREWVGWGVLVIGLLVMLGPGTFIAWVGFGGVVFCFLIYLKAVWSSL